MCCKVCHIKLRALVVVNMVSVEFRLLFFFLLYHVSGNLLILSHLFGRQLLLSLVAHLHFVNPHCWESRRGVGATPPRLAPSTPPQAPSPLLTLRAGRWGAAPRQRLGKAVKAFGGAQTQAGEPPSPPFVLHIQCESQPSAPAVFAVRPDAPQSSRPELCAPVPRHPTRPREGTQSRGKK